MGFYSDVARELKWMVDIHGLGSEPVTIVSVRPLSPAEAIGCPDRHDYPLLKGKEVMVEADFRGTKGQAFTDKPGNFQGTIDDILSLDLSDNFRRALFISGLNAIMGHLGRIRHFVHCKNKEPAQCARLLPAYIRAAYGKPKVALIGFQPAMAEELSRSFALQIVDLSQDNVGKEKFGVIVHGPEETGLVLSWADLVLVTGSTCVNGTMDRFLAKKPGVFYGVTIAGIARLFNYKRYCPMSQPGEIGDY